MKIVIDIPDSAYKKLMKFQTLPKSIDLEYFIIHGKPLPKGHGRLIDVDDLIADLIFPTKEFESGFKALMADAPTIIEADKEELRMEKTLFCEYCNRIVDERCDLCKYKEEAHEVDPEEIQKEERK